MGIGQKKLFGAQPKNLIIGLAILVCAALAGGWSGRVEIVHIARGLWHAAGTGVAYPFDHTSNTSSVHRPAVPNLAEPNFPLKIGVSRRFLVDQNDIPFLIMGDSAHGLMSISPAEQEAFFAGRAAEGVNALWVELLCSTYSSTCPTYNGYNDTPPFTRTVAVTGTVPVFDLSTPNPAYFGMVDNMLNLAANHGIVIFLDPTETGGWLTTFQSNGASKDFNYGAYLGNRYKNYPNIVWQNGNDFQTWSNPADDAVVSGIANGIKSADPEHIQTVELDFDSSDSLEDPTWAPIVQLNTAYSYYPQYDRMLTAYNRTVNGQPVPAYFLEGVYEYQTYEGGYSGPHELRAQEYWVMLSGAAGQMYGNATLYPFPNNWNAPGWDTTPGFVQFTYANNLFATRAWYNLVPDQSHSVVTSGLGTYSTTGLGNTSNYLTAARTSDGSLVMAYMPTARTITVDMTKLAGPATARWYDPSSGEFTTIPGSPYANSGSHPFTPPSHNSSGDPDWVLVLESSATLPPLDKRLYLPLLRHAP
jgi:hypothetical protein